MTTTETRRDEIPCRECLGTGGFAPLTPWRPNRKCEDCQGTGKVEVENWDVESLLAAGSRMTYEEAVTRMMNDGEDYVTADHTARAYGKVPTPVLQSGRR